MDIIEKTFKEIHDIYESWDGGQISLDITSEDLVKEAIQEAINFTDSSLLLKEKETPTFDDWKKRHLIDRNLHDNTYLHDTEGWIKEHRLIDKYNSEVMNL